MGQKPDYIVIGFISQLKWFVEREVRKKTDIQTFPTHKPTDASFVCKKTTRLPT